MSMRGALIAGLLFAPCVWGQSLIDPDRLPTSVRELGPQPSDQTLRCEVTPLKASLDFNFRFQTGYSIGVPMAQYFGPDHGWLIVTRVTPQDGTPVWLAARVKLPDVPLTTVVSDTFGGFLVGAGRYKVDWAMFDDEGRVCRKQWKIEAKLSFGERHVTPLIPPHAVADFSGAGLPSELPAPADASPFRLTILLHAAPASPRRLHLRVYDRVLLLSTLSALLERAKPTSVRLEVFNFDKQRVIYGNDDFTLKSMGDVAQTLNRLELETIDVKTLQNRSGATDLLASLIGKETASSKPSDAVVFLGPAARYVDKLPASTIEGAPGGMRFYYFQYRTFIGRPQPAIPDIISSALSTLKGRVFQIYSPGQFADAIRELQRMSKRPTS
jgi:hypothetical protein